MEITLAASLFEDLAPNDALLLAHIFNVAAPRVIRRV